VEVLGLMPLACVARADEVLNHSTHVWEVEVAAESVQSALHQKMAITLLGQGYDYFFYPGVN
jgi:hypothetical protein